MAKTDAPGRKTTKAEQILAGARDCFLEHGYEACSVDLIARHAGVSKATLYAYYRDKHALFAAVVHAECSKQAEAIIVTEPKGETARTTLREIARSLIGFMTSPFAQAMFRMVVAESGRFPDLGRTFYQSGPQFGASRLADLLETANARGDLRIDDIDLASHQFVELCRAELFYKALFGMTTTVGDAEIDRIADGAVAVFLAAYGSGDASDADS